MNIIVVSPHTSSDPGRVAFYNQDASRTYVKIGISTFFGKWGAVSFYLNLLATAITCRLASRRLHAQAIISQTPNIAFFVGLVSRITLSRVPHIAWDFNTQGFYHGLRLRFARFTLKNIYKIVVYSRHERELYKDMLNISDGQAVFKLYSGCYMDDRRYTSIRPHKTVDVVSAGFSGRDYHYLARVARILPHLRFLILTYPHVIASIRFPPNVQVVGNVPETDYCRHIASARVMLLPIANTETANGHIAITQAMSFRTLLVTNPTPGTSDYLQPGVNCLTYAQGRADETAALITSALNDQHLWGNITEAAYQYATTHFVVARDVELLNSILP